MTLERHRVLGFASGVRAPTRDGEAFDRDGAREGLVPDRALVALQLCARGYTYGQIAALCGAAPEALAWDLQAALAVLGAPTVRAAVAEARRRGLLV